MSTIEVRVPQLPESVADATLVAWRKQPGDAVNRDENLVDLETDKVVLEVPAPATGVLKELKVQNGSTVTGGQVLAVIEEGATATAAASTSPAAAGEVARRAGEGAPPLPLQREVARRAGEGLKISGPRPHPLPPARERERKVCAGAGVALRHKIQHPTQVSYPSWHHRRPTTGCRTTETA
jgi:pyruvate/2-oxoglutarate dehydrogenase complex dihydrolipoamide acyltransferase (E2) component